VPGSTVDTLIFGVLEVMKVIVPWGGALMFGLGAVCTEIGVWGLGVVVAPYDAYGRKIINTARRAPIT